jgi:hypothetical protein
MELLEGCSVIVRTTGREFNACRIGFRDRRPEELYIETARLFAVPVPVADGRLDVLNAHQRDARGAGAGAGQRCRIHWARAWASGPGQALFRSVVAPEDVHDQAGSPLRGSRPVAMDPPIVDGSPDPQALSRIAIAANRMAPARYHRWILKLRLL